ncbi:MAG: metallophosphoesterase [Kofleriaceae bacterium]|nr:metallophosphoesterase [Myxococcales bacterium]MCB9560916.1 metallophosphoesterase [Kofleriaceae bacterium]
MIRLPDHGRLIVCTDLQGCLRDYRRIVEIFHETAAAHDGDAHLLFTGDLIHGPHLSPDEWPDFLGEYYRDASGDVVEAFADLAARNPGHVHALVGNHEHGHIGGPHTAKFAADEVSLLEDLLGQARTARLKEIIGEFALAAVAPCGAVFTHGAPAAEIASIRDVEGCDLQAFTGGSPLDILDTPVLGPILWARSADVDVARAFVRAMGGTISIYGHDVIPEGFECVGDEQMVVSTSFGVFDSNKVYLSLDLGAHYKRVQDLRIGREILPLYPDRALRSLGGQVPD